MKGIKRGPTKAAALSCVPRVIKLLINLYLLSEYIPTVFLVQDLSMRDKGRTCTGVNPKDSYLLRHNLKYIRIGHLQSFGVVKALFCRNVPYPISSRTISIYTCIYTYTYVSMYMCVYIYSVYIAGM